MIYSGINQMKNKWYFIDLVLVVVLWLDDYYNKAR